MIDLMTIWPRPYKYQRDESVHGKRLHDPVFGKNNLLVSRGEFVVGRKHPLLDYSTGWVRTTTVLTNPAGTRLDPAVITDLIRADVARDVSPRFHHLIVTPI